MNENGWSDIGTMLARVGERRCNFLWVGLLEREVRAGEYCALKISIVAV